MRVMILLLLGYFLHLPVYADEAKPLIFQVHPFLTAPQLKKRFTPLVRYLEMQLAQPVTLTISKNYVEHAKEIAKGKVDIAYMGSAIYVEMTQKFGKHPILARLANDGKPSFRGAIIKNADNNIANLAALKGKRFAFGSPHSTMSYLVPRYMLYQADVGLEQLTEYAFLGNHQNVALSVLNGQFDAGAVKEDIFFKYEKRGLKLLQWTPEISSHLFIARQDLPEALFNHIKTDLLDMGKTAKGLAILRKIKKTISGLTEANDTDYDNLRTIMKVLEEKGLTENIRPL